MWKKCTGDSPLFFISQIIFSLFLASIAAAQSSGSFVDGKPTFAKFATDTLTRAVTIDDIVILNFNVDSSREAAGFQLFPSGIDPTFAFDRQLSQNVNNIALHPLEEGRYIITDAFNGQILFVDRAGRFPTEFKPDPDSLQIERPISVFAFVADSAYAFDGNSVDPGVLNKVKFMLTDQGRERIVIFDELSGPGFVEWIYPDTTVAGLETLNRPSAALAIPGAGDILICDTDNDRLVRVDKATLQTVRIYDGDATYGTFNRPVDIEWTPEGILVTDRDNHRVLLIDPDNNTLVRQFGTTGVPGSDNLSLNTPVDADYLDNGDILIADSGNRRVFQVNNANEITWEFLGELNGLEAVQRIQNHAEDEDKTVVVSEQSVLRLSYRVENDIVSAQTFDLGRQVDFLKLNWEADEPPGTKVNFQVRTGNSLGEIGAAQWRGPNDVDTTHTAVGQDVNQLLDGNRFYQVRAIFQSDDPLRIPNVSQITISYRFFSTDTTGIFTSEEIADTTGNIITTWDELVFNSVLPLDLQVRDEIAMEVAILNAEVDSLPVLRRFLANPGTPLNTFDLSDIDELRTIQKIRLQATLITNNTSASPALDDWQISWQTAPDDTAEIQFVDAFDMPINSVRTVQLDEPAQNRGVFFVSLEDGNLNPVLSTAQAIVFSLASQDSETVTLELQQNGSYEMLTGMEAVIWPVGNAPNPQNNLMEVRDRDVLVVRYVDPTNATDVASDTLTVTEFTAGILTMETRVGVIPDSSFIAFQDTLFLRVAEERDHDLSAAQDTIFATLFDNDTNDREDVMLLELPTPGGTDFSSGEFLSQSGISLVNISVSTPNDGVMQTRPGNFIGAEYVDGPVVLSLSRRVEPDTITVPVEGAFDILFAPNPFRTNGGNDFRMRILAGAGSVALQRVEIFNLAGEKIRTVSSNQINITQTVERNRFVDSRGAWWDLLTDNGAVAASGTYWARCVVSFNDGVAAAQERSIIRKFIIIHQ